MTTSATTSVSPYSPAQHPFGATYTEGLVAATAMFFKEFFETAFNPYHPEKYYMRGPGPACRAKAGMKASAKASTSKT